MNDDIRIGIIATSFKAIESALRHTGLTLAHGGEDTIDDGLFCVYDGDRFVGVIRTSAFDDPVLAKKER